MGQADSQLFVALARTIGTGHFNAQDLVNTAWAFATTGKSTPALLDPILLLDKMELKEAKLQVMCYQMLLARVAPLLMWRMSDFNAQDLANTAWLFATVG